MFYARFGQFILSTLQNLILFFLGVIYYIVYLFFVIIILEIN